MGKKIRTAIATLVVAGVFAVIGLLAFIHSGLYPIGASAPHLQIVRTILITLQMNSVREHAEGIDVPPLRDPELVRHGFDLYQTGCLVCHGAPGVGRTVLGRGLNPAAPPLITEVPEWNDAELYWIIENGLKMTGMPGFGAGLSETDIWALVAFTRRLPELSVEEYRAMVLAAEGVIPPGAVEWVEDDDAGFVRLLREGEPERGEELMDRYGCGTCHVIPGVKSAKGKTGPPLTRWAERHFIAGTLINTPENLVRWIVDPHAIEPGTTMPELGVTPEEALDMAAHLYTLGSAPLALHAALREAGFQRVRQR